jgi:hypothetical protein
MKIGNIINTSFLLVLLPQSLLASGPLSVQVTLRGKKYSVPSVTTVKDLQSTLESQSGISTKNQGRVLFGGKKLKPADVLEDVGVEDGSMINMVPGKSSKDAVVNSDGGLGGLGGAGGDDWMKDMLKNAGLDPNQLDDLMNSMPGGGEGGMPSMEESMSMMQDMMNSPLFKEYMEDPEKLEQSRQMILSNPMMKGMMASMPGFDEILNDPVKWRETMIAAANMYKSMGSDLSKLMDGSADFSGMGMGGPAGLDDLSEGED